MGMILMYALPLIIIIFCYVSIYIELYKKSRKSVTGKHEDLNTTVYPTILSVFSFGVDRFRRSNDDVLGRAKRKTLRMTITIVIVFVVSW